MPSDQTHEQRVLELLRDKGLLRPKDLTDLGIPRSALQRLYERGEVRRVARGLYELPHGVQSEHRSLLEVAKRVPDAVVCLLSALAFHEIGTQIPHAVWIAIGSKARRPRIRQVALEVVRFSEESLRHGVEEHRIEGVRVRVTSPPKTVADCFKYRRKIGVDVAVEALRESWRDGWLDLADLREAAKICRVENVIRPYVEALT